MTLSGGGRKNLLGAENLRAAEIPVASAGRRSPSAHRQDSPRDYCPAAAALASREAL